MVDSGLAAYLLGTDPDGLARPTAAHSGQLLESFVAGELARQLTWSDQEAALYHWRDRSGVEVDLLLETPDGRVAGVEVLDRFNLESVPSQSGVTHLLFWR